MANIKTMQEQMDLFENGGLKDDGMTKDPISNNPIPTGSMANEVRDDIPAMLSEGEYVVPADVLRYYGVSFFENLRNQAKNNLTQMERSGRIGGEPLTPEQAQRNMQIKPIGMPKPQGVNEGGVMQGFSAGNLNLASPFSTMSSSYYQNLTPEERQAAQNAESTGQVSFMRPHYNREGEIRMIEYVGTTAENATIKLGQEELLKLYPLTEEQYNALVSASKDDRGDDGPDLDPDNNPKGSDISWADGIDWSDDAAVKAWAMESVKVSPGQAIAGKIPIIGPIAGAMATGNYAKGLNNVMGVAGIMEDQGRSKLSEFLKDTVTEAITTGENAKNPLLQGIYALGGIGGNRPRGNEDLISKILGSKTSVATPTPTTTPTPKDDDRPNLAERMQRDATRQAGEQAQKSLTKFKESEAGKAAAAAPAASKSSGTGQDAIDRTSDVVRDMQRGVQRGFKKGGLATRRKTKGK